MTMIGRAIRRRPLLTRWLLAGPAGLIAAALSMATMPLWLPEGEAGANNFAFPLAIAPLLWMIAFIYVSLESDLVRAAVIVGGLTSSQLLVTVAALL